MPRHTLAALALLTATALSLASAVAFTPATATAHPAGPNSVDYCISEAYWYTNPGCVPPPRRPNRDYQGKPASVEDTKVIEHATRVTVTVLKNDLIERRNRYRRIVITLHPDPAYGTRAHVEDNKIVFTPITTGDHVTPVAATYRVVDFKGRKSTPVQARLRYDECFDTDIC